MIGYMFFGTLGLLILFNFIMAARDDVIIKANAGYIAKVNGTLFLVFIMLAFMGLQVIRNHEIAFKAERETKEMQEKTELILRLIPVEGEAK